MDDRWWWLVTAARSLGGLFVVVGVVGSHVDKGIVGGNDRAGCNCLRVSFDIPLAIEGESDRPGIADPTPTRSGSPRMIVVKTSGMTFLYVALTACVCRFIRASGSW
jgi:hypothetical protein